MKITDELLYQHAAEARDIWLDTLPNEDELPEHQFSDEFMASFETMKKQEKGQSKKRKRTPLQRVAAVFLAVLIGSGTWLGVDAEARAAFVSWFREFTGKSAVYTYVGEVPESEITDYLCTWLPDGMEAIETDASKTSGHVIYTSPDDDFAVFSYTYMHSGTAVHLFPTGDELVHSEMQINGMHADFYEEPGEDYSCFIIWFDEANQIFFDINGNLSKEETIRMAESVQKGQALELLTEYTLTWLPDGYRARELAWGSHSRTLSCLNEQDHIRLDYEMQEGKSVEEVFNIDEFAESKAVTVWGQDATLYLNTDDDEHTLVWADEAAGIAFCLEATENEEIMLRVAEAVSAAK